MHGSAAAERPCLNGGTGLGAQQSVSRAVGLPAGQERRRAAQTAEDPVAVARNAPAIESSNPRASVGFATTAANSARSCGAVGGDAVNAMIGMDAVLA